MYPILMHRALTALCAVAVALTAPVPAASAAVSAAATQAPGASPLYGVEIIVFRASSPGSDENWDTPIVGRGFGTAPARGAAPAVGPSLTRVLTPGEYRLTSIDNSLKSSGAWRPIAHAAWIQTAANWGTHVGFELSQLGINAPGLTGTVYLERAPIYLHLGFDLQYQGNAATYTMKEMRSVKYNDKQYFDHPAFGIIAIVTQIKRTEPAAPAH